jgi:uncharacterized membrane protein
MTEILLIGYIVVVSIAANRVRKKIHESRPSRGACLGYIAVLVALALIPFVWAEQSPGQYSAATVVLIGVAFFWFPILASRVYLYRPSR